MPGPPWRGLWVRNPAVAPAPPSGTWNRPSLVAKLLPCHVVGLGLWLTGLAEGERHRPGLPAGVGVRFPSAVRPADPQQTSPGLTFSQAAGGCHGPGQ